MLDKVISNLGIAFVVAFIIMLTSAAIALALGSEVLANKMAEVAYYFLLIGVVTQLIEVVKVDLRKRNAEEN